MRTTESKNKNQFPTIVGRANSGSKPKMINLDEVQLNGRFKDINQSRPIRATLHHLDGNTSQIIMSVPKYSTWSDYEETAAMMLKEYCNVLASHWLQLSKFVIEFGDLDCNGVFQSSTSYNPYEIPVDKVFVRGGYGEWVDYHTAYNADAERQCIALENGGTSC